jgi:hypothetical protein
MGRECSRHGEWDWCEADQSIPFSVEDEKGGVVSALPHTSSWIGV